MSRDLPTCQPTSETTSQSPTKISREQSKRFFADNCTLESSMWPAARLQLLMKKMELQPASRNALLESVPV